MRSLYFTPLFLLAATLFTLPNAIAEAKSTFAERVAISKQLVLMDSPRDALVNTRNKVKEHPMYNTVMQNLDFSKINQDAAELMAANFNIEELNALLDFYQQPAGRAAAQKMGTYKNAIGLVVHDEMMKIIREEKRKQQGGGLGR